MARYHFSTDLDDDTTLCIAPLTDRHIAMSGQNIPDASGYFLYETCKSERPNEVRIIAQLPSEKAAVQLSRMFSME